MIRVLDIETTGLDPAKDAICEIASVDMVKGGGVTNRMSTFVNPGRPIPPSASAIHHILDEDVKGAPAFRDIAPSRPARQRSSAGPRSSS